jgi:hypothetical protein
VTFGETVTHLVWSNGTHSRLAAAIVLGIKVVSPGWINECKQCRNKADESNYIIMDVSQEDAVAAVMSYSNDSSRSKSQSIDSDPREVDDKGDMTLRGRRAGTNINILSNHNCISTSSSVWFAESDNNIQPGNSREENVKESGNHKSYQISNGSNSNSSSSSSSSNKMKAPCPAPFIPLPSFKEHNPGVLPSALRTQRRSERICDLDEENDKLIGSGDTLEDILNIDPNEVLPILRDSGCWPPSGEEAALIDEYKAKNKVREKGKINGIKAPNSSRTSNGGAASSATASVVVNMYK